VNMQASGRAPQPGAGLHTAQLRCGTMQNNAPSRMYPKQEAAQRLGISVRTLAQLISDGEIESVLITPKVRVVSEKSIADYIERRRSAEPARSPNPKAQPRRRPHAAGSELAARGAGAA
jgi:excisionase family DNA binding protein